MHKQKNNVIFQEVTWTWTDPETKRGFEFTLVGKALSWDDAENICASKGTKLAQPDSQAKNENIKTKLRNFRMQIWFGARKVANNQWQYTDGSALAYYNWGPGIALNSGF